MQRRLTLSIAAIALLVAACGGANSDGGGEGVASLGESAEAAPEGEEPTTTTALDPEEAQLAFQECMAQHGIETRLFTAAEAEEAGGSLEVEEFEASDEDAPPPPDPELFEAAQEECGHLMEDAFGEFELSPEEEAERRDAALQMQRCMEDKGIEGFEADTEGGAVGIRIDPEAEDFEEVQEAMRECSDGAMVIGGAVSGGRQVEEAS